ncbi:MAG: hypothetical protein ABJA67_09905 [Chthonomonadales bacterium]
MKMLDWQLDENTLEWIKHISLAEGIVHAPQFPGKEFVDAIWLDYISNEKYPNFCYSEKDLLICSPENIVRCFHYEHMLEGLALTIMWGRMWRTQPLKYMTDKHSLHSILIDCAASIVETNSIEQAWIMLRKELQWTDVMTSKTLHFLARSQGFEQNPGVAIDNAIIIEIFWPECVTHLRRHGYPTIECRLFCKMTG